MALLDIVKAIASRKNATPPRPHSPRLFAQKSWIVPIPETTKLHRLDENLDAVNFELNADDLGEIESKLARIELRSERLAEAALKMTGL